MWVEGGVWVEDGVPSSHFAHSGTLFTAPLYLQQDISTQLRNLTLSNAQLTNFIIFFLVKNASEC